MCRLALLDLAVSECLLSVQRWRFFFLSPTVTYQPTIVDSSQLVLMILIHFQPTFFFSSADGLFACFGYISLPLSAFSSAFTL